MIELFAKADFIKRKEETVLKRPLEMKLVFHNNIQKPMRKQSNPHQSAYKLC